MSRVCEICGKGSNNANSITRRGKAKKEGGVGKNITGKSGRKQRPNLKKVNALIDGKKQKVKVCTQCIKSNKVIKAH